MRVDRVGHLTVRAHAKINLTLDVLGRRDDGYHALRSVMQTVELHDTLDLEVASSLAFSCDDPSLDDTSNLVFRAAALLRNEANCAPAARIALHKRIPAQAGLGGGSSDAASTLLALNRLWGLHWPLARLAELAARLGSDVPFFLHAPTAIVGGRGEDVVPLAPLPVAHVVLACPPIGIATARAFAALSPAEYGRGTHTDAFLAALREGAPPSQWPLANDLQGPVCALYPAVAHMLETMRMAGGNNVLMTGSGSAAYALFDDSATARTVHERLRADGITSFLTRTRDLSAGPVDPLLGPSC